MAATRPRAFRRTCRRLLVGMSIAIGTSVIPDEARAVDPSLVAPIEARWTTAPDGSVEVAFDVSASFTERFRRRLAGGLLSTVVIETRIEDLRGRGVRTLRRECQLRFELWEDRLLVRISEPRRTWRASFLLIDEALRTCGVVEGMTILDDLDKLGPGARPHRLVVKVVLNPVPDELLAKTREFTSSAGSGVGRGRALIGAVARLFRSDLETSDETFQFRSQPLARPVRATTHTTPRAVEAAAAGGVGSSSAHQDTP